MIVMGDGCGKGWGVEDEATQRLVVAVVGEDCH